MTIRLYRGLGDSDPPAAAIEPVFSDPYLELVRLLTEAAQLEHTLLLADLRCLFSIKPRYGAVRGTLGPLDYLERNPEAPPGTAALEGPYSMLDVAIEEMQHLDGVNRFLVALGASPCLVPHPFPEVDDIYPFQIPALGLDRYAVATFMWVEADACALSLSAHCAGKTDPDAALVKEVRDVLSQRPGKSFPGPGGGERSHVGSLYHQILALATAVSARPPAELRADLPWATHLQQMRWIAQEGEVGHYGFFRAMFTGSAFGGDGTIWLPGNPDYPAFDLQGGTAYPGDSTTIADLPTRRLAWLADLHYWVVLALLDARYRDSAQSLGYHAVDVMTLGLLSLGTAVAERGYVLPFDPLGPGYVLGRGERARRTYLGHLVAEAQTQAAALGRDGLLPAGYDVGLLATVAAALGSPSS